MTSNSTFDMTSSCVLILLHRLLLSPASHFGISFPRFSLGLIFRPLTALKSLQNIPASRNVRAKGVYWFPGCRHEATGTAGADAATAWIYK